MGSPRRPLQFAVLISAIAAAAQLQPLTPAQRAIAAAEAQIKKEPKASQGYNDLAKALVRRARETGDPDYYGKAAQAVENSLRIEPDNFEGYKAQVMVLLGGHEYAAALELA